MDLRTCSCSQGGKLTGAVVACGNSGAGEPPRRCQSTKRVVLQRVKFGVSSDDEMTNLPLAASNNHRNPADATPLLVTGLVTAKCSPNAHPQTAATRQPVQLTQVNAAAGSSRCCWLRAGGAAAHQAASAVVVSAASAAVR